ncbi:MAG: Bug family tripartite tricarboxylate transporter substrate binding protein [Betaproteobacteria bacterium]
MSIDRHPFSRQRRNLVATGAAAIGLGAASGVLAQSPESWPNRPIRLLVGFAPGGSSDVVSRLMAQRLSPILGQQVVVENRPGAGGLIAAEAVARAQPDGYTWALLPSGHASQAAMLRKMPVHPLDDFAWVSTITVYPMFYCVAADSPIRSLRDLIERAKANPGKLSFSSLGIGAAHHLLGEWINAEAGIDLAHVPYKGSPAAFADVVAGRVDLMVETAPAALPLIRGGKVRALAVTSREGTSLVPGVPAASDTIPGLEYESWLGIVTTPKTPQPVVDRLNRAIREALADPEIIKKLEDLGGRPGPTSPEQFRDRVQRDIDSFRKIVSGRGIPQF